MHTLNLHKKFFPLKAIFLTSLIIAILSPIAHVYASKQYKRNAPGGIKDNWEEHIPQILKKWIPWVLRNRPEDDCPFPYNNVNDKICISPSGLTLALEEKTGAFTQSVKVYKKGWVSIPGDAKHWPQQVKANNIPITITPKAGRPAAYFEPGSYKISGSFKWQELPDMLPLPQDLGLVTFSLNGKKVDFPNLDTAGRLWIKQKATAMTDADTLGIKVFRHVIDNIPFTVNTRIMLNVSGKNREILLDNVLLTGFTALRLISPLPAHLESDGKLRVKLRPGNWMIDISSYQNKPVYSIKLGISPKPWPDEEIWVFEARNHLRIVDVGGVPSIDARQTDLPGEWSRLPAYYLKPGDEFTLTEKKRGDSDTQPDILNLSRDVWLDFDGKGYTIKDSITGRINKSSRLVANPETKLGRVSINGMDQFITKLKDDDLAGVEVRKGNLNLTVESRVEDNPTKFNAVGWAHDFRSVAYRLHLPPGWRVFLTKGVDKVSHSWFSRWTLFDIFLVLFVAVAIYKLLGTKAGITAFITLILVHTELPSLSWMILMVVGTIALHRVLPDGVFKNAVIICRRAALLGLVLLMIPFMLYHMRNAIHPQLEGFSYGDSYYPTDRIGVGGRIDADIESEEQPQELLEKGNFRKMSRKKAEIKRKFSARQRADAPQATSSVNNFYQYDVKTVVQTGYGVSNWRGKDVYLSWSGPVSSKQEIELWFMPPALNLILAFIRLILLTLLTVFLLEIDVSLKSLSKKAGFALGIILPVILFSTNAFAEDNIPSDAILQELGQYVIKNLDKPPDCLPQCASISRMKLQTSGKNLTLRLEVHVDSRVAIPLPKVVSNNAINWKPDSVLVDGAKGGALLLSRNGYIWVILEKGVHQLITRGKLPDLDAISINFILTPYYSEYSVAGWELYGIHKNGETDSNIQLVRTKKAGKDDEGFEKSELPPLLRVERTIFFGISWTVNTRVVRVSPRSSGVVVNIPLLDGESVTTPGIRVKDGAAIINMGANTPYLSWESVLKKMPDITLKAPQNLPWTEVWRLNVTNLWHTTYKGIPKIHADSSIPEWRPWPGEVLSVSVIKPEGMPGPTKTIDKVNLTVNTGQRTLDAKLEIRIKSSRGEQHQITLPEGSQLQEVKINNQSQPIQLNENKVPIFLAPGKQNISVSWKESRGISNFHKVPEVDLGFQAINIETVLTLPRNRWVLFTGGPLIGPAVLFWGVFPVLVLLAFVLGLTNITPLKNWHWLLLMIGLSQTNIAVNIIVVGWLLMMGWRAKKPLKDAHNAVFDLRQVILGVWSLSAVISIFIAIQQGLLGSPDMKIIGNGSSTYYLRWFQDIASEGLIRPWVFSINVIFYRILMLLWALWLAFAFTSWLKWAWTCFSEGGFWRFERKIKPKKQSAPAKDTTTRVPIK